MKLKRLLIPFSLAASLMMGALPNVAQAQNSPFVVGFVLVGPQQDKGWNEAQLDATTYVTSKVPNTKAIVLDKLNPADRPNTTLEQVVDNMVSQGAKLIFTTSDDFGADTIKMAQKYPNVTFIHTSG